MTKPYRIGADTETLTVGELVGLLRARGQPHMPVVLSIGNSIIAIKHENICRHSDSEMREILLAIEPEGVSIKARGDDARDTREQHAKNDPQPRTLPGIEGAV